MNINNEALTALVAFAVGFYMWMEAFIKPSVKALGRRYRPTLLARWFPMTPAGDKAYDVFIGSAFRVLSVFMGVAFVAINDIGVSFFDVFWLQEVTETDQIINVITTGFAIGLGDRGTHFLVDMFEDVFRFFGRKASQGAITETS